MTQSQVIMLGVLIVVSVVYVISVIRNFQYAKRDFCGFSGLEPEDPIRIKPFKRYVFFGIVAGLVAGCSLYEAYYSEIVWIYFILVFITAGLGVSYCYELGGKAVLIGMVHNYLPALFIFSLIVQVTFEPLKFPGYVAVFFSALLLCISFWHSSERFRDWLDKKFTTSFHNTRIG